jgi:SAM-dependent methyltransferase
MKEEKSRELIDTMDKFIDAQENFVQWGIPFKVLFKSRFALFFFSFLFSHYSFTFRQIAKSNNVLDVGCGMGLPVRCLRILGLSAKVIGIDIYGDYLKRVKKSGLYDDCVLASVKYLPFRHNSFDSVICLQVLEHLPKTDGVVLLGSLINVANKVVLTTPVGFVENNIGSANVFQDHKSGWYPRDLRALGFKVKGYGGVGVARLVTFKPFMVFNVVFVPLIIYLPELAFHMFAVRESK